MPRRYVAKEFRHAFDTVANALTVIQENHRMIHDGFFFSATHRVATLANGADIEILLSVPADTFPHLQAAAINANNGGFTIKVFEGTTTTADGTAIAAINRNRNSALELATLFTHTPTITADGTELESLAVPDTVGPPNPVLWDERILGEWIFKPSTKYLIRINNESGQVRDIQAVLGIYEIGAET